MNIDYCLVILLSFDSDYLSCFSFILIIMDNSNNELDLRKQVMEAGLKNMEEMSMIDDMLSSPASKRRKNQESTEETGNVCEITKKICYLSMVRTLD